MPWLSKQLIRQRRSWGVVQGWREDKVFRPHEETSKRPGPILTRVRLERTPFDSLGIPRVRKTLTEAYWWLPNEAERRVDAIAELLLGAGHIDAVEQLFWEAAAALSFFFQDGCDAPTTLFSSPSTKQAATKSCS